MATGLGRRKADVLIAGGKVKINGQPATLGQSAAENDQVTLDGRELSLNQLPQIMMLNKPIGYVCSRNGQGSKTIYDLLSPEFHNLKPVGRLDKNSSGLLLLTNDGTLAQQLTHPKFSKQKVYEVELNKELSPIDQNKILKGIMLHDGLSRLKLEGCGKRWQITMSEGRNRQIRRTFDVLGYEVIGLQRIKFGGYILGELPTGQFLFLNKKVS